MSSDPTDDQRRTAAQKSPLEDTSTAAKKFRDGIESKQAGIEDYDPEEELWTGGYSGKAMVGTWVLIGIASIGLVGVAAFFAFPLILIAIPIIWAIGGLAACG